MGRPGREARTVAAMIGMNCRGKHGNKNGLCADCAVLLEYVECGAGGTSASGSAQ